MDFTTASSKIGVVVECLPEVVDGFASRFGTSIDKHADIRLSERVNLRWDLVSWRNNAHLKNFTNPVKEPSMGVDLLLVLSLQD